MKRAPFLPAVVLLAATPVPARAQLGPDSEGVVSAVAITSVVSVAAIPVSACYFLTDRYGGRRDPNVGLKVRRAELFLRENVFAVEESVSAGHGAFLDDLAAGLEIRQANRSRFGRLLRAHRRDLLALADPTSVTPERAVAFFEEIRAVVGTDEALLADLREAARRRSVQVAAATP